MDPAGNFRTLVKKKSLPFGEGELRFVCVCVINHHDFCSSLEIVFIFLFGCGDPGVLPSLSAADSKDRAVTWLQEYTLQHERHHLYPGF